jgi:hypothetical protein
MPTDEQWNGLRVLVDDRLRSVAFDDAAMQLGWVFVREAKDAGVFVVQNPAELDDEMALAAALSGGWVMAPDTLVRRSGICLKLKSGLSVRRKVLVTDAFKTARPSIAALVEAMVADSKVWKVIADIDAFATVKATAARTKCPETVIALIGGEEAGVFAGVDHCFDFQTFLSFVTVKLFHAVACGCRVLSGVRFIQSRGSTTRSSSCELRHGRVGSAAKRSGIHSGPFHAQAPILRHFLV